MVSQEIVQRFEFGQNWLNYILKNYTQERIEISKKHMLNFLKLDCLDGLSFLDIGCGSGIHSFAALQAGASMVHSFDYDSESVLATQYVKKQMENCDHWIIEQGSVLDLAYLDSLPQCDIVYSWGVLHHTGAVWSATENAAKRVKLGGLFYIALYSADMQVD